MKADPAAEPRTRVPVNPLLKPLEEFHAATAGQWHPDDLGREVHGYATEFLIATVPDPIDSPFGYAFDQAVDAIQRGVQQKDGYLLDRAWLPWEVDRKPKPAPAGRPAAAARPARPHARRAPVPPREGRRRGVNKPGLCVVFLVGETPLGGIHKRAFWKCLNLIGTSGQQPNEPVRVVGPYFTGSQTSLQFLIDDWMRGAASGVVGDRAAAEPVQGRRGNASGMRTKEFFHEHVGAGAGRDRGDGGPGPRATERRAALPRRARRGPGRRRDQFEGRPDGCPAGSRS